MGDGRIRFQRDAVLYVGLNDSSAAGELDAIRKGDPGIYPVTDAGPNNVRAKKDDSYFITEIGKKPRTANLAKAEGRAEFVKSLGLPQAQSAKLEKVLADAPPGIRDELAQIAVVWARAERGGDAALQRVPSRLVLSGHSEGDGIWGERGGDDEKLTVKSLEGLAQALPRAAAQVEDLAISACSCGGRDQVEQWRKSFPKLKTMLAYRTSSPTIEQGSAQELERWEKLTRGAADSLDPHGFNPNAATWSVKNGYLTPNTIDVEKVRATIAELAPLYRQVRDGEKPLDAGTNRKLQQYRNALRELGSADNETVTPEERADATNEQKRVLFLQHWDEWKGNFAKTYGRELDVAYRELGLKKPARGFDQMTRAEAHAEVKRVIDAVKAQGKYDALDRQVDLFRAVRDLDPHLLKSNWIR